MRRRPWSLLPCFLLLFLLGACQQEADSGKPDTGQKYFFLEALKQVEDGGRRLQSAGLDQAELTAALEQLDRGLQLAFQVRRSFLDELDLRLGKNFERFFIRGVENYRIGIEAGDEAQQREGLRLLQKWADFWQLEQQAILSRLHPE